MSSLGPVGGGDFATGTPYAELPPDVRPVHAMGAWARLTRVLAYRIPARLQHAASARAATSRMLR